VTYTVSKLEFPINSKMHVGPTTAVTKSVPQAKKRLGNSPSGVAKLSATCSWP